MNKCIKSEIMLIVFAGFICVIMALGSIELRYQNAINLYNNGNYIEAHSIFSSLSKYKQSMEYKEKSEIEIMYRKAIALYENNDFTGAFEIFELLKDYKASEKYYAICLNLISNAQKKNLMQ